MNVRFQRRSSNPREPLYYAKLAIIELCGWIESAMDDIIRDCAGRCLRDPKNLRAIEDNVIERTHSFSYDPHFRLMLIHVVGLAKVEELERMLDANKFHMLKSALGTLKAQRDREAHTYTSGVTQTILAPSILISQHFPRVYEGLTDIERCVRRLRL